MRNMTKGIEHPRVVEVDKAERAANKLAKEFLPNADNETRIKMQKLLEDVTGPLSAMANALGTKHEEVLKLLDDAGNLMRENGTDPAQSEKYQLLHKCLSQALFIERDTTKLFKGE